MTPSWNIHSRGSGARGRRRAGPAQPSTRTGRAGFAVRRIVGEGDLWVTEYAITYEGRGFDTVSIMEFQAGKVDAQTQYFAEPFEPPASAPLGGTDDVSVMPDILFQDVSKTFGKEAALHGITVAFVDGVTTAVVGPSGSGKSTLLQLINGLVRLALVRSTFTASRSTTTGCRSCGGKSVTPSREPASFRI